MISAQVRNLVFKRGVVVEETNETRQRREWENKFINEAVQLFDLKSRSDWWTDVKVNLVCDQFFIPGLGAQLERQREEAAYFEDFARAARDDKVIKEEAERVVEMLESVNFALDVVELACRGVVFFQGADGALCVKLNVLVLGSDLPCCFRFFFHWVGPFLENTQFGQTWRRVHDLTSAPTDGELPQVPVPEDAPPTRYDTNQSSFADICMESYPFWNTKHRRFFGNIDNFRRLTQLQCRGVKKLLVALKPAFLVAAGYRTWLACQQWLENSLTTDARSSEDPRLIDQCLEPRLKRSFGDGYDVTLLGIADFGLMKHARTLNVPYYFYALLPARLVHLLRTSALSAQEIYQLVRNVVCGEGNEDSLDDSFERLRSLSLEFKDKLENQMEDVKLIRNSRTNYGLITGSRVQISTISNPEPQTETVARRSNNSRKRVRTLSSVSVQARLLGTWTSMMEERGIDDPDEFANDLAYSPFLPPILDRFRQLFTDDDGIEQFASVIASKVVEKPGTQVYQQIAILIRFKNSDADAISTTARDGYSAVCDMKRALKNVLPITNLAIDPKIQYRNLNQRNFVIWSSPPKRLRIERRIVATADDPEVKIILARARELKDDPDDTLLMTKAERQRGARKKPKTTHKYDVPGRPDIDIDAVVRDLGLVKLEKDGKSAWILVEESSVTYDNLRKYAQAYFEDFGGREVNRPADDDMVIDFILDDDDDDDDDEEEVCVFFQSVFNDLRRNPRSSPGGALAIMTTTKALHSARTATPWPLKMSTTTMALHSARTASPL